MRPLPIKSMTLGHSQHGKSTVGGFLYLKLVENLTNPSDSARIQNLVTNNVEECLLRSHFPDNLRYALIFDGIRGDIWKEGRHPAKTFTTKPFTLKIENEEDSNIELTDLPGHQTFLKRISGSLEFCDIGIFVIDSKAFIDNLQSDKELKVILEEIAVRPRDKKDINLVKWPTAPLGYKKMLDDHQQTGEKKKKQKNDTEGFLKKRSKFSPIAKPFKQRMHPPTISGIYNYLSLSWHFGIRNYIVCIHKMDLLDFDEELYLDITGTIEYMFSLFGKDDFLSDYELEFVPTSIEFNTNFHDDRDHNLFNKSSRTQWYKGETVFEIFSKFMEACKKTFTYNITKEPTRFQINSYNHKWKTEPNKSKKSKKKQIPYIKTWVYGYLHSGIIEPDDQLCFSDISAEYGFSDYFRVFKSNKPKTLENPIHAGQFAKIFLNNTDLNSFIKTSKEAKRLFYEGNFIVKENEKEEKPVIIANKLYLIFSFISGWRYTKDFYATIIYGMNKSEAIIWVEEFLDDNKVRAVAHLKENHVPVCYSKRSNRAFGKIVIEKHTYIIGVGEILEVEG